MRLRVECRTQLEVGHGRVGGCVLGVSECDYWKDVSEASINMEVETVFYVVVLVRLHVNVSAKRVTYRQAYKENQP